MKYKSATVSNSGVKIGDLVLMNKANGYYGRVIKITRRFYEKNDAAVRYRYKYAKYRKKQVVAGEEAASSLMVTKIINLDLTQSKRKSTSAIADDKVIVISKSFISKMFKKLNDALAFVRMINGQDGIT